MPRIDPPMIRPRVKGDVVIGGPNGSPIILPAGIDGATLTLSDGSPAWIEPAPTYTQEQIDPIIAPLINPGLENQVLRVVDGTPDWTDEVDAYTKAESDALLELYAGATHTHVVEDVGGLDIALEERSLVGHTHNATEIVEINEVIGSMIDDLDLEDLGAAAVIHTHVIADVDGLQDALDTIEVDVSWGDVSGKPTTFSPTAHTHPIADVTGLQAALDNIDVDVSWGDVSGKPTEFTPVTHAHPVTDLTATGTRSSSTYLRGDGTWNTPTNTTYSEITTAEITAGTASTLRTISGRRAQDIVNKSRDGVALAASLATVATSGSYTDLSNKPSIPAQINAIAGTNMTITGSYPNLTFNSAGGGGGGGVELAGDGVATTAARSDHGHRGIGTGSVQVGDSASASDNSATAVGAQSIANILSATAVGYSAYVENEEATSIGAHASSYGDYALSIGAYASTMSTGAIAIGVVASANGADAVALGRSSWAVEDESIAIGSYADASHPRSIVIGDSVTSTGPNSAIIAAHTLELQDIDTNYSPATTPSTLRLYDAGGVQVDVGVNAAKKLTVDGVEMGGGDNAMIVVSHGTNTSETRPAGAAAVYWIGTVAPDNGADGDLWIGGL